MAYTCEYGVYRLPPVPVVELVIGNPGKGTPSLITKGIVDSGADCTVIPLEIVRKVDLPFREMRDIKDFSGKTHKVAIYSAKISITTLNEHFVRAIGIDAPHVLAGRDVINHYKVTLDGRLKKIEIV
ncbi:MAG TPA: hypothetical protein ACFYEM_03645 [Candidatus Hypogeohydataceae bacterium YC40]